jgi:hypothetical protein
MSISAATVAGLIRDFMVNNNNKDVLTIQWDKMYKLAERERWKEAFQNSLTAELRKINMLVVFGSSVVVIAKDYNFSPFD